MVKNIVITVLLIISAAACWLAWRNSQPLQCDRLYSKHGYWDCTLYIKQ